MEKKHCVSIIIPVLNEQAAIQSLVERIEMTATIHKLQYEIIFVDDHSTDKTQEIITILAQMYPIKLLVKRGKAGKAQSLLEGFAIAQYDMVCMIDGDLQYPPESIPEMIRAIDANQADIIVGNRKENRTSKKRKILSNTYRYVFGKFLHHLDCDVQSGLKVFRREILQHITIHSSPWTFDMEFLIGARKAGYTIASQDIIFYERLVGKTKIGLLKASIQLGFCAINSKLKLRVPSDTRLRPLQHDTRLRPLQHETSQSPCTHGTGENKKRSDIANRIVILQVRFSFLSPLLFGGLRQCIFQKILPAHSTYLMSLSFFW